MPPLENRSATHAPAAPQPSEKAKVSPKPSQDHLNDQPMPPVENRPATHAPAAFSDEEEGAPFPLPESYYRDVLPAPTD
ncbi:hypothetical protein NLI96_g7975 [Meripilus lineatus]|uniref:Uncharacterized protein n=1 Tax=Meripilus lineatus TaxID=2056292 RepID=A0AAD5UYD3_9APHY|nr:hypothetical protein NLI96_g7975 [Physisporinus lineatus]